MNAASPGIFLTANWRHLAMLNFEIDPAVLARRVPRGTELDFWEGRCLVSVVGFQFLNTRVFGVAIPFHRNFEEVNLRFYVRRKADDGWRRGVVFVKEIVPCRAIAAVARWLYNEPYVALPMSHELRRDADALRSVEYLWGRGGERAKLRVSLAGDAKALAAGSEAEFITEHYWGYNSQRDGSTLEYRVEHPRWNVWDVADASLTCDAAKLYGREFAASLGARPSSAFLAEGSAITVARGVRLGS
jgi:uncharacterized protein YqjF (DUF2071 family)